MVAGVLMLSTAPAMEQGARSATGPELAAGQVASNRIDATVVTGGPRDYVIGQQDLLEIRVFDLAELNQVVRVEEDGNISLPLVGRLHVDGMAKSELEAKLSKILDENYLKGAPATVFVREAVSKRISVSGAVRSPGSYDMPGSRTLLEVLSAAGGLLDDFGTEIVIFRKQADGSRVRLSVDSERLLRVVESAANISLAPGDLVHVPTVRRMRIFVGGSVRSPNMYEVREDEPITLLKAITMAGGTTERALLTKIKVIRTEEDGVRADHEVNLHDILSGELRDELLKSDDVVFVPTSFF
jgi:polysaccharide export outer membrane protein